ncbi:MAG: hypothetical protein AAGJ40_04455 [Planctomycetota bacterium]
MKRPHPSPMAALIGITFALMAAFLSLPSATAAPRQRLDEVVEVLAGDIAKFLRNQGQSSVLVEPFNAPSNTGTNLQIQRRLKEALSREDGITVIDETQLIRPNSWSVRGDYSIQTRPDMMTGKKTSRAQVTARLFDERNIEQHTIAPFDFGLEVNDVADVAVLASATFDASEAENLANKIDIVSQKLTTAIENPDVSVDEDAGRVSASDDSPYSIELLICDGVNFPPTKSDYLADATRLQKKTFTTPGGDQGYAIADLRPGEFYAIRVHNQSDRDVAVKILVDGLSTFEFSDVLAYKRTDHWIISAGKTGTVYGWHRTNDYSDSFEIAHLPNTAVGKSGRSTSHVGMIQAVFFQAWSENETPPAGELVRGAALDALGTKQGTEIKTSYREVRRFTSKTPIASISVRYAKPQDDLPPAIAAF